VSGRASSRPPGLPERYAVSDSEHAVPPGASRCCSSWCRDASRFRLLRLDLASNFSLDEESSLRSLGDGPEPRRRSFDLGISILVDGPIRRVMYFPCLTAGDLRFLVPPLPARGVGLPYGWLTAEVRQTLSGLLRPAYARCERVGYPHDSRGGSVPSHAEASPACLREGGLVPALFSHHHRLCHPRSDDLFLRSLIKGSLAFTRPLFTRGRVHFVAKLPLRHYPWLHTLPLPGTHAGIGDRLGHEPGGVLCSPLTIRDLRIARCPQRTSPIAA
jgi:hypothetical protein